MANLNPTTNSLAVENLHQTPGIGELAVIPVERLDGACILLRAIVAMDEIDDSDALLQEGESYEALARRIRFLKRNLHEVADQARALIR